MAEKQTKILKLTIEEWKNASRDKRELSVCRDLGMDVIVMAKGTIDDRGRKETIDGFDVIRFTTRPLGNRVPTIINRTLSIIYFALKARKLNADIISGHDLGALFIGWLSTLFLKNKAKLVYDSHEFELGRNINRSRVNQWLIKILERFLIRRCAFSMMVNDVIAEEVQNIYHLKAKPVVVRNIPNYWKIDNSLCEKQRESLLSQMSSPTRFLLMYHGAITRGRGIEELLQVLSINSCVCAVILGNASNNDYLELLKKMSIELGISNRVLFHSAVSIYDLWRYVGAADIGMVTIPAMVKSYYFMLPNKFFENIQSETPVICSNYPAITPLVQKYSIGLTCNPNDINALNECIEKMRTDNALYQSFKNNIKVAKDDLCWEKESVILKNAYLQLLK